MRREDGSRDGSLGAVIESFDDWVGDQADDEQVKATILENVVQWVKWGYAAKATGGNYATFLEAVLYLVIRSQLHSDPQRYNDRAGNFYDIRQIMPPDAALGDFIDRRLYERLCAENNEEQIEKMLIRWLRPPS